MEVLQIEAAVMEVKATEAAVMEVEATEEAAIKVAMMEAPVAWEGEEVAMAAAAQTVALAMCSYGPHRYHK